MKTKFLLLSILLSLFGFNFAQTVDPNYVDGTVYIKFKASRTPKFANANTADKTISISEIPALQKISPKFALKEQAFSMRFFESPVLSSTVRVTISNSNLIDEFIEELSQNPDIEYIEKTPLYYISSTTPPNDTYYGGNVSGQNLKWYLDMIKAEAAWGLQVGKPNVKVAVVDNAIWGEHPDLKIPSKLQYNVATYSVGSSKPPYLNQDENCSDPNNCKAYDWSHGTHCAGVVGAINNNDTGIASIGGGVTLMGVSCQGSNPRSVYNAMAGVQWAAENGAKVISMSWGGNSNSGTDRAIFSECEKKGIILIAAAGNNSSQSFQYPAAYPEIISVASIDYNERISSFSNYGSWVQIASPGGYGTSATGSASYNNMIFSTTFNKNVIFRLNGLTAFNGVYYDGMSGTSMACPIAAGLCGLLASYDSTLTTADVRAILQQSSTPLAMGSKKISAGVGYINAEKALLLAKSNLKMVKNPKIERTPASVEMSWEAPDAEGKTVSGYRIAKNGNVLDSNFQGLKYSDSNLNGGHTTYNISAIYQGEGEGLRYTKVIIFEEFFTVKVNVEPFGAGTVTGDGSFENGSTTKLIATPNEGYTFMDWSRGSISESFDNPYNILVRQNITYTANFKKVADNQTIKASQKFNIFPNPAQNEINFESDFQTLDAVYIVNSIGARVKELKTVNANQTIHIGDLKPGAYIIIALSNGQTVQAKFTKLPN